MSHIQGVYRAHHTASDWKYTELLSLHQEHLSDVFLQGRAPLTELRMMRCPDRRGKVWPLDVVL